MSTYFYEMKFLTTTLSFCGSAEFLSTKIGDGQKSEEKISPPTHAGLVAPSGPLFIRPSSETIAERLWGSFFSGLLDGSRAQISREF